LGERRRVEIEFLVSVAVSDLFIDLSVFELEHGSVTILDARMGVLHLTINSHRYCMGVVDLNASFAEATLRRGVGGAELTAAQVSPEVLR
jgi:hypothetical protein